MAKKTKKSRFTFQADPTAVRDLVRSVDAVRELAAIVSDVNLYVGQGFMNCHAMMPDVWNEFKERIRDAAALTEHWK